MVNKDYCKSWVDDGWFDSIILFFWSQCWCGSTQGLNICDHFHWGELAGRLPGNFLQQTLGLGQVAHLGMGKKNYLWSSIWYHIPTMFSYYISALHLWFCGVSRTVGTSRLLLIGRVESAAEPVGESWTANHSNWGDARGNLHRW